MNEQQQIKIVSDCMRALIAEEQFTPLQTAIIEYKYLNNAQPLDIRRLSRQYHKPMKLIKREVEKADRKLYALLKERLINDEVAAFELFVSSRA